MSLLRNKDKNRTNSNKYGEKAHPAFLHLFIAHISLLLMTLLFSSHALAAGNPMMFDVSQASEFLKYIPPIISSVHQYPPVPDEETPVKIVADVGRIHFGNKDFEDLDSVTLFYSIDGGASYETIEMDQSDDDQGEWTAEIPEAAKGTEVQYYLRAKDTVGNAAIEMPPSMGMSPEWNNESNPEDNPEISPYNFLNNVCDHKKPEDRVIPDYLKFKSLKFGYTDKNFYFQVEHEAPVDKGTITPININLYGLAIINRSFIIKPGILKKLNSLGDAGVHDPKKLFGDDFEDFVKYVWIWFYSPLLDIAPPFGEIGKIPPISLVHVDPSNPKKPIFESNGWKYNLNENFLDLTVDRDFIGPSIDDTVTFVSFNGRGVGKDFINIKPEPGDPSCSISIIMKGHSYTVGGE